MPDVTPLRVVIVGAAADRDRLRAELIAAGIEVAAAAPNLAAARAAGTDADAFVLASRMRPRTDDVEALTPRERDVLQLVALGLPNKAIAARLGISDQTVKFHVAAIIGKLGAANRTDVVRRAARRGLVDL